MTEYTTIPIPEKNGSRSKHREVVDAVLNAPAGQAVVIPASEAEHTGIKNALFNAARNRAKKLRTKKLSDGSRAAWVEAL
jgi:hypothetical protein